MNEFIHSIENIFNDEGVLKINNVSCYYIAPYQRGYKWASESKYDQVPQMLIDVYTAMKYKTQEYYLQYITLMKRKLNETNKVVFEVIDGQQRLTTLSIFFYCLEMIEQKKELNIAADKVIYSRYTNNDQYRNIFKEMIDKTHEALQNKADQKNILKAIETQDLFYMTSAALRITAFIHILNENNELSDYLNYLKNRVKLIVNLESEYIKPEDVFSNLNDNKVALTNAELIKGLLLTKGVNMENHSSQRKHYKEIINQRSIMGRMWDEICAWIEQPDVCRYFFGVETNGIEHLLSIIELQTTTDSNDRRLDSLDKFIALLNQEKSLSESKFILFDQFNDVVSSWREAQDILLKIKHIYRSLRDIYESYENTKLYNLLGFWFFAAKPKTTDERIKELRSLITMSYMEKIDFLKSEIKKQIPNLAELKDDRSSETYYELRYASNNEKLTNLLLSFSVFPEDNNPNYRFNFYQYDKEKWSFEHIFPQNPKNTIKIAKEAKAVIKALLESTLKDEKKETIDELHKRIENNEKLELDEKLSFLYKADFDIDSLGNMALLSNKTNSALSNNPYVAKRPILSKKISEGDFVPRHTIDIFHKSMNKPDITFNMDLTIWNGNDVNAHVAWMEQRNSEILNMIETR